MFCVSWIYSNSVKHAPPVGFFGIRISLNSISAGAPPPDPAGGAYDAPRDPLVGRRGGYSLPISHPVDAFGVTTSTSWLDASMPKIQEVAATLPRRMRVGDAACSYRRSSVVCVSVCPAETD